MKKGLIVLGVVVLFIVILVSWGVSTFNGMTTMDEGVTAQWKQVEVAYQARMDKTKNLMAIVQGAANFEKGTLTAVVEARAKATSIQIDPTNLTPEKLAEFDKAQSAFGASLGRLMAISENYPQLQAVQGFRDFQAQYEGMENRIATERRRFNQAAQQFNTVIRTFPSNIFAGMFGFHRHAYFEAQQGAANAPDINFSK